MRLCRLDGPRSRWTSPRSPRPDRGRSDVRLRARRPKNRTHTLTLPSQTAAHAALHSAPYPDIGSLNVLQPPSKTVILPAPACRGSEAPRRSFAYKSVYRAKSKDLGDAYWQMLFGAFRPQTTKELKNSQAPTRFLMNLQPTQTYAFPRPPSKSKPSLKTEKGEAGTSLSLSPEPLLTRS